MAKYDMEIATLSEAISNAAEAASDEAVQLVTSRYALDQLTNMYCHVKQFGVDRTFLRLYNSNHELDNALHMQFPSCESMNLAGDNSDMYSTAFITAMESEGEGLWATLKRLVMQIINWIRNKIGWVIKLVAKLFHPVNNKLSDILERLGERIDGQVAVKHYSVGKKALYYLGKAGVFFRDNWRIFAAIGSLIVEWRWLAQNRKKIAENNDKLEDLKKRVEDAEDSFGQIKAGLVKEASFNFTEEGAKKFYGANGAAGTFSLNREQAKQYIKQLKDEQSKCEKESDRLSKTSVDTTAALATISAMCAAIGRDPNQTGVDRQIVSIGTKIIAIAQGAIAAYTGVTSKSARTLAWLTGCISVIGGINKLQSAQYD